MNLLLIGGIKKVHKELIQMGHQVTLICRRGLLTEKDLKSKYKHIFILDDKNFEKEVEDLSFYLHDKNNFHRVLSFHDDSQILAISIAKKLKLPILNESETVEITRDKVLMRKILSQNKIKSIPFREINSKKELVNFMDQLSEEVIIKPLSGAGSKGVFKISNNQEIDSILDLYFLEGNTYPVIAELYIKGDEYSVECFSHNKKHKVMAITKKYKDRKSFIELGHTLPAPIASENWDIICKYVESVLEVIGVKNGPTHTEIILSSAGPIIIETHTRNGGDRISDLLKYSTGINQFKLTARQAIGEDISEDFEDKVKYQQYTSVWHKQSSKSGVVKSVFKKEILDEGVKDLTILKNIGEKVVGPAQNSFDRLALAIATDICPKKSINSAQEALKCIDIKVT